MFIPIYDYTVPEYLTRVVCLQLRHEMIEQREGETEIAVKIHFEDMRRVATRRQRYFHAPIDGTPFSLAIVLPDGYGMYELLAEQELRHSQTNGNTTYNTYFVKAFLTINTKAEN